MPAMRRLLQARSVAVVGASERPDAPSGFVIRNLLGCGFTGRLLPIHPSAATIYGHAAVPKLADLATTPDVVVVAIPAAPAVGVVDEAASLGIKAAVVLGSGFAETDAAGAARQGAMAATARAAGMALCGPNCLGLYNLRDNLALFSSRLAPNLPRGDVAIISHSGAGAVTLANTGRFGLSAIISAGNAVVTDVADYLGYFAATGSARVVALMLEQIGDPAAFAHAMHAAHAAGLVVVALRSGRSARGAAATAAHTGALAGSNDAFAAFFRRHGVLEAADMDGVIETCVLASSRQSPPRRPGLAALGVSGGGLAHVADLADAAGVTWATLADTTTTGLAALLPSYVRPTMPLDMTGIVFGEPQRYRAALDLLAADPGVGQIVAVQDAPVGLDADGAAEYAGIADAIAAYATTATTPIALLSLLSGGPHPQVRAPIAAAGVPILQGGTPGMAALANALNPPTPTPIVAIPALAPQPDWVRRLSGGPKLTEREAKAFLAAHGVRITREALAITADEAARLADTIGYPVVMKIESADIPHKTEIGGVHLGIATAAGVRAAHTDILAAARHHAPHARVAGVVVQEMVTRGTEALVGLSRHPPFGLALTVGPGGVLVEWLGGHALNLLPLDTGAADRLIGASKLAGLLAGLRGQPAADRAALADLLVRLGQIAHSYADQIAALDLNPVAVLPRGQGVCVLDALLIRNCDTEPRP